MKGQFGERIVSGVECIRLTLPFPPTSNRYWRNLKGTVVKSAEAREYREACQLAAVGQAGAMIEGPVSVEARYYFPDKRGDLDNRLKQMLDGLQGAVIVNDSQVVELHAVRLLDRERPRVEVRIAKVAKDD